MTCLLSKPAESLLESPRTATIDTLVVGSGYGAAMAALRLSDPDTGTDGDIWVLERGREYQPGEFPKTTSELPGHVLAATTEITTGNRDALFDLRLGDGASALMGSGLGGTSLINGGVAIDASEAALSRWPTRADGETWQAVMSRGAGPVKRILGVTRRGGADNVHPAPESLGKFRALRQVADALRAAPPGDHEIDRVDGPRPIPLAISFEEGSNAVGVHQQACIDCGNCITGCNVGAKNTLAMNVWPLAASRGVRIYTGVSVVDIVRDGDAWRINCALTAAQGELEDSSDGAHLDPARFQLRARRLILAAGTFGSTEILLRSGLTGSSRLGEGFSVNGDMMVLGLRRTQRVDSAARAPSTPADRQHPEIHDPRVGPLTMSEIRVHLKGDAGAGDQVSIQDGAVPYPMRRIFTELLTTEHLARLFVDGESPQRQSASADPLSVDHELADHSQLMTVMGWEPARGSLRLRAQRHAPDLPAELVLQPHWDVEPETDDGSYFNRVESLFNLAERNGGFDGGQLLPCPPWRMIPDGLEALEGLGGLRRHLVTTHPLGGCCMGRDASEGVVDENGRVFCASSGTDTHPDLYVMDGAAIPGPVGVNPFMTIATLAYVMADRLAQRVAADRAARPGAESRLVPGAARATAASHAHARYRQVPFGHGSPLADPRDEVVAGSLEERLFLDAPAQSRWSRRRVGQLYRALGLKADERLVLEVSTRCDDLYRWLEAPATPLPASFRFARSTARGDTVPDELVTPLEGASFQGTATLGGYAPPGNLLVREWRRLNVLLRFFYLRGDELLTRLKDALRPAAGQDSAPKPDQGMGRFIRISWSQARVQSSWRYMRYQFEGTLGSGVTATPIRFLGQKTLSYRCGQLDPLSTLRLLPFTLDGTVPAPRRAPRFRVDMIDFTRDLAPFQATRTPDTPSTVLALAATAMFFLRGIVQTHFWSFGAPGYGKYPDQSGVNQDRLAEPPPALPYPNWSAPSQAVREDQPAPPVPGMRLVRYRPGTNRDAPPVLLIHGLAHGSRVFWTETVEHNLAQHLLGQGFDVWLLDHRLSCNLNSKPDPSLSMEEIAAVDIPWAVRTVYQTINRDRQGEPRRIGVMAHCIGAGAFAIATLNGRLRADDRHATPMVGRTVIHAVTPWLVASEDNRWRANVVSMFRSYFNDLDYDPIPHADPTIAESLADRFSSSFGWSFREFRLHRSCRFEHGNHFSRTICNRMTLFYGDEWLHENLDPRTHANLHTLVGPAPIEVLRQVYYCIVRGRLTNREGANEYLREDRLRSEWTFPTLFLHGDRNKVFNADGSRTTAHKLRALVAAADGDPSRVALRIVPNYGHMDLLFGRNAHQDVYPYIADHLLAGERADSPLDAAPHVAPRTPAPVTGPIISAPSVRDGRLWLTVWTEANRNTTREPEVHYLSGGRPLPFQLTRADTNPDAAATAGEADTRPPRAATQLGRIDVTDISAPVELELRYRGNPTPALTATFDWHDCHWYQRALNGGSGADGVSFLVGSCLHPGVPPEQCLSDAIFDAMRPFVRGANGAGVDHLLLVGDQIYADATANLFDPAAPLERFRDRYRRAFGGPGRRLGSHAHWVLSHLPTYFAVDDHEVSDNWPQDLLRRRHPRGERYGPQQELDFARAEAHRFMMHQSPDPERLFYDFCSGGQPFFVFDTRTERRPGRRSERLTVISDEQSEAFETWLRARADARSNRVFIVTGSPLGPISHAHCRQPASSARADTLLGHPGFVVWLVRAVKNAGIDELVWFSGDAHLSCLGELRIGVDQDMLTVNHIVASGLFAPLPFANPAWENMAGTVRFGRRVEAEGSHHELRIDGTQTLISRSNSHFVQVHAGASGLAVRACDASGNLTDWIEAGAGRNRGETAQG